MPKSNALKSTNLPLSINELNTQSQTPLEIGAAYIRVSTDDQTELSPDAQLREILATAKVEGYVIPREFIFIEDKGRSGRRADNRPEFQRMISIAKQQPTPFSRLYLWKFSRFARNQEESTFYKGILRRKCGIDIKSISEPIIEGVFGRLIEMIIEWFDEYYSINLSGEVIRGMTEKALRNGYQTTPSLGYDAAGEGKPFVINEEKYAIAAFIHKSYYNGMDMTSIARACNSMGYRTRRGNVFDIRAIKSVLENHFYIGLVKWRDICFQGTHEVRSQIADIFEANQTRLQREHRPSKRREVSSCAHWLSGLLKCSTCGASLGYRKANSRNSVAAFQCWKYAKGIHSDSCSVSVKKAEQAVIASLQTVLETGEVQFAYIRPMSTQTKSDRENIESALSKLSMKELRVKDAYENGIDTLEEYRQNRIRLSEERERLIEQMNNLTDDLKEVLPDKSEILKKIQEACDLLQDTDLEHDVKGNALRRIIKQIDYNRQKGTFSFYYYI